MFELKNMGRAWLTLAIGLGISSPASAQLVAPVGQPAAAAPHAPNNGQLPAPVVAPFELNPKEQTDVDVVLRQWQQSGSNVKTFGCDFTLFEYNGTFGSADKPIRQVPGEIKYVQPDKGLYRIHASGGEYWICDGKAIYEFNSTKKELIENRLPPELQGKSISDGPLPFVFGVDAEKLKQRYWVRIITPSDRKGEVWLQAYPRHRQDAANFQRVEIILSDKELMPYALQLFEPAADTRGETRKVYTFGNLKVNSRLHLIQDWMNVFVAPQTPLGWQRIVQEPPTQPLERPVAGPGGVPNGQSQLPAGNLR